MGYKLVDFESFNSLAKQSRILPKRLCLPGQNVSWRIGKESYQLPFSNKIRERLALLGMLCKKYHDAVEDLFFHDTEFRKKVNMYREKSFLDNFNRAKDLSSGNIFYRPDLVITEDSQFKIAEIDALPGELGVHSFLLNAYGSSVNKIVQSFEDVLKKFQLSQSIDFVIDSIISEDEYVAEYTYLASCLSRSDITMRIYNINEYSGPEREGVLVYRFFDMVRNNQVQIHTILDRIKETKSYLYPPIKHYLEEKFSLSCVHDKNVETIFLRHFTNEELSLFRDLLPKVHYLDKQSRLIFPPIQYNGSSVVNFSDLALLAPNIPYVLKTSAFSDQFSTSKGAILLEGLSKEQINSLLEEHINKFDEHFILQEKITPLIVGVQVVDSNGINQEVRGFSRLTPFYFVQKRKIALVSSHIVIREKNFDVHFASDSVVIPAY